MRLADGTGEGDPVRLLCRLHDAGIDTHHSSQEYSTHQRYLAALKAARSTGRRFQHIVKLAEPSFDRGPFDTRRITRAIEAELASLGAETIACLQWLFRTPRPEDIDGQRAMLIEQREEIAALFDAQKRLGNIGTVSPFPYSTPLAGVVLDQSLATTLTLYLNLAELEYVPLLDRVDGVVAIRPLAGGRLAGSRPDRNQPDNAGPGGGRSGSDSVDQPADRPGSGGGDLVRDATRFPLLHPSVTTTVISMNSPRHVAAAIDAAGDQQPDLAAFDLMVQQVAGHR